MLYRQTGYKVLGTRNDGRRVWRKVWKDETGRECVRCGGEINAFMTLECFERMYSDCEMRPINKLFV